MDPILTKLGRRSRKELRRGWFRLNYRKVDCRVFAANKPSARRGNVKHSMLTSESAGDACIESKLSNTRIALYSFILLVTVLLRNYIRLIQVSAAKSHACLKFDGTVCAVCKLFRMCIPESYSELIKSAKATLQCRESV
jgi:hypothetical protein